MKSLLKKAETLFAAAAFAEEGEIETARQIMKEDQRRTVRPEQQKRKEARPELRAN